MAEPNNRKLPGRPKTAWDRLKDSIRGWWWVAVVLLLPLIYAILRLARYYGN